MIDEPIAEIRAIRHQISQECHHDTNTYLAYLWQQEDEYREQIEHYRQMTRVNSIGDWQEMANRNMSPVIPLNESQPVPA